MKFLDLAKRRCTIRSFIEQPIEKEKLDYILEVGRVAPTACNKQPQRIIVVQKPDNIIKIQKAYKTFGSQWRKRMKACFSLRLCFNAPHLAETTSPTGSVRFAKLSKRELDFVLFFLLPCGAKPSALVVYTKPL